MRILSSYVGKEVDRTTAETYLEMSLPDERGVQVCGRRGIGVGGVRLSRFAFGVFDFRDAAYSAAPNGSSNTSKGSRWVNETDGVRTTRTILLAPKEAGKVSSRLRTGSGAIYNNPSRESKARFERGERAYGERLEEGRAAPPSSYYYSSSR